MSTFLGVDAVIDDLASTDEMGSRERFPLKSSKVEVGDEGE